MDKNRPYIVSFIFFAIIIAVVGLRSVSRPISEWSSHNDFAHYYVTSRYLYLGGNAYSSDTNITKYYSSYKLVNEPKIEKATNPPALSVLLYPFIQVSPNLSFWLWSFFQLFCLLGTYILSVKILDINIRKYWFFGLFLAPVFSYPFLSHFEYGQSQFLIGFLIVLGISSHYSEDDKAKYFGSFLWGLAAALKFFTWPFVLLSIRFGGVRGLLAFVFGFFILNAWPLHTHGHKLYIDYFQNAVPYILSTLTEFNSGNSLLASILNTLDFMGFSAPSESFVSMLIYLCMSLLMTLMLLDARGEEKTSDIAISSSLCLVLSCLLGPTTWSHYFVVLLFPLLTLFSVNLHLGDKPIHRFDLILAFVLFGLTQGRLRHGDPIWELVGTWWGVIALSYLAALLYRSRKTL